MSIDLHWQRRSGRFWNSGIVTLKPFLTQQDHGSDSLMTTLGEIPECRLKDPQARFWFWQDTHRCLDKLSLDRSTYTHLITEIAKVVPYEGRG